MNNEARSGGVAPPFQQDVKPKVLYLKFAVVLVLVLVLITVIVLVLVLLVLLVLLVVAPS